MANVNSVVNKILEGVSVREAMMQATIKDPITGKYADIEFEDPWNKGSKASANVTKNSVRTVVDKALNVFDKTDSYSASVEKVNSDIIVLCFYTADDVGFWEKDLSKKFTELTKNIQGKLGDLGIRVGSPRGYQFGWDKDTDSPCIYVSYDICKDSGKGQYVDIEKQAKNLTLAIAKSVADKLKSVISGSYSVSIPSAESSYDFPNFYTEINITDIKNLSFVDKITVTLGSEYYSPDSEFRVYSLGIYFEVENELVCKISSAERLDNSFEWARGLTTTDMSSAKPDQYANMLLNKIPYLKEIKKVMDSLNSTGEVSQKEIYVD